LVITKGTRKTRVRRVIIRHKIKIKIMAQDNQKIIVTQSQLKFVFDYTNKLGVNLKLKEIVGVTNVLVDYCINGYSKEIGDRLESIDKFILDKFNEHE
jgi:hypothetical protein